MDDATYRIRQGGRFPSPLHRALPFVVWLGLFGAIGLTLSVGGNGWPARIQLARHGKTTIATIVRLEPQNHNGCVYEFVVDGESYSHSAEACDSGVGSGMVVTYLPDRPSVSESGRPDSGLRNALIIGLGVPTLFATVTAIAVARSRSKFPALSR